MLNCITVLTLLISLALTTIAFQPAIWPGMKRTVTKSQHVTTIFQQTDADEEYEGEEFFVSQEQLIFLRKEASKRESKRKLPKWILSPEEAMDVSQSSIEKIIELFDESEIIEVRGISRDKKKYVYDTAHGLAEFLEDEMCKPVVVVNIKGFAAKMFSPWLENRGNNIQLRSSFRPGQWTKKPKPLRDNRGQIIKGEDGKSIKEIPSE